jgi:ABC-2 type transport system permease protein
MSPLMRLELLQLTRNAWFRAALVVLVIFTSLAVWMGATQRASWQAAVSATRAETERVLAREQESVRLNRQEGFNPPGTPSAQAMDATLPTAPGVLLAIGDAPIRPTSATVNATTRADTHFKNAETGSALTASLGTLDLAWVVVVLLPTLIIALTHDVLAAERDSARLSLLRAQGGGLNAVLTRRLVVRLCWPLAILTGGVVAACLFGVELHRAALWWLISVGYLLLWGLIGGLISVRAHSAQGAAAALLLCWLGTVVILPAALSLAVESLAPMPSRIAQVTAMREVQLSLQQRTSQLLDRYFMDHPELAGSSGDGFARSSFVAQRETEARLAPVLEKYEHSREVQRKWLSQLMWLSPPMLTHATLTRIAGTDGARHESYVRQVNVFAGTWREHVRDRIFLGRTLSAEEIAALPRFKFEEPDIDGAVGPLTYLVGLLCLLLLLLTHSLRATDLR